MDGSYLQYVLVLFRISVAKTPSHINPLSQCGGFVLSFSQCFLTLFETTLKFNFLLPHNTDIDLNVIETKVSQDNCKVILQYTLTLHILLLSVIF